MSGLTGYLTSIGVDLSSVFMPIENNTFNNGLVVNNNITLPTTYSSLPTTSQLGGIPTASSFTATFFTSSTLGNYNVGNIILPVLRGVYFIHISLIYTQTTAGTIRRNIIGLSLDGTTYVDPILSQFIASVTMSAGFVNRYLLNTMVSTTSANQPIYVLCAFFNEGAGRGTVTGTITYTRIA
jgi:hypothetical protein